MAARFWVNGTGTWDASNTANWAATTGGTAGASVPGPADTVTFDANSGTGFTVTVATGYNPTVISVTGGFATVTLNLNDQTLTCTTFNFSGAAVGAVRTLAWGNSGQITITGNGTTVFTTQIDNNLTCSGSRNVVFTYSGGVGTRTIGTVPAGANFATNSLNYIIQGGTDTISMTGSSGIGVRNLDLTGFSGTFTNNQMFAYGNVTLSAGMTLPVGPGNWTLRGPSGGIQTLTMAGKTLPANLTVNAPGGTVVFADDVTGSATATLTLTAGTLNLNNRTVNIGIFSSTNSNARTLAFGTTGVINISGSGTTVWSCGNAASFTYTGTPNVNFTYSGNVGTRTVAHGNSGGTFPVNLPPPFNFTAGADTIATTTGGSFDSFDFTGFGGSLTNTARALYGNFILSPTMTLTGGTSPSSFTSSATQLVDTANLTIPFPLFVGSGGAGSNGVVQLANALTLTSANTLTLTSGTLATDGYPVSTGSFNTSGNLYRVLDISNNTLDLTGTGIVFTAAISTNLTLITANSTVLLSNDTIAARIFVTGNQTYNNVIIGGNTATSNTTFTGNATFNTLSSTKTVAHTVRFTAGSTTTVNAFDITGTAGNVVTITSDTASQHNLVYTGAGTVNTVDYLDISYSNASPAVDTWYPGLNSINSGNNTGWMFPSPPNSGNFFLLF